MKKWYNLIVVISFFIIFEHNSNNIFIIVNQDKRHIVSVNFYI